jgi:hypothetical protein
MKPAPLPKPPHPKGPFHIGMIGDVPRILDEKGRDVMTLPGGMERLVACANAIRHDVWFPDNHVSGLESQNAKLEQLRRAAWDEVQILRATRPAPTEGERAA